MKLTELPPSVRLRQQEAHLSLLSRVKVCLEEAKFLTCNQPAVVEISLSIHCLSIVAATYYDHDGDDDDDDDYVLRENMCHMPPHSRHDVYGVNLHQRLIALYF